MTKQILIWISCFSVILQAQTVQEAVGFFEYEEGMGIKAAGMGNAFTAVADDYSAIYWNPAGLALLEHSEFTGDLTHLNISNEAVYAGFGDLGTLSTTKFKSLGIACKAPTTRGNLVMAFGYHRFKDFEHLLRFSGFSTETNGLSFRLEDDWGIERDYPFDRQVWRSEEIWESGSLNALTAGVGMAMSPAFMLGASVQWISGESQYLFNFYQEDTEAVYSEYPADYCDYELNQDLISNISGFGMKIGGLFRLDPGLHLGFSIDLPTSLKILETWSENDALRFDDDYISEMDTGISEWEYVVKYPAQLSWGIALDRRLFLVSASCRYRDWTKVQFDTPNRDVIQGEYLELLSQNRQFKDQFRGVLSWSIGGEYRVAGSGLKLRGGYQVVPSSLAEMTDAADRQYYSGGIGYDLDKASSLQVSYSRGHWTRDTSDGYTPVKTHEKIRTDRVMAGLTLKF